MVIKDHILLLLRNVLCKKKLLVKNKEEQKHKINANI